MADAGSRKRGLTPFGWLLVAGGAAFLLSNKDRRDKALAFARGLADKLSPSRGDASPA